MNYREQYGDEAGSGVDNTGGHTTWHVYSTARHTCPECPWTYDQARPLVTWWEHWRAEHWHRDPEPPPALSRADAARLAAIRIERERRR